MNKNSTIYIVNRNEIEDIAIDRSVVEIRNENLLITILNVIGNCFINNIVFILIKKYIIMFYFHKIKYDK